MIKPRHQITFFEYQGFLNNDEICDRLKEFSVVNYSLGHLNHLSNSLIPNDRVFNITHDSITARHIVGVICFNDYQIEILPKLLGPGKNISKLEKNQILKNLMFMLSYTHNLMVKDHEISLLGKQNDSFLEIYINIFATRLLKLIKKGFPCRYLRTEEELGFVKGKIVFSEYYKRNIINRSRITCEYDEFSEDNIVTRILKFVSKKLITVSSSHDSRTKLKTILRLFSEVKDCYFTSHDANNVTISRNNENFDQVFNLAKMFLNKMRSDFSGRSSEQVSILFNMNDLFEEFVFEFIKRNKVSLGIKNVSAQKGKRLVRALRERTKTEEKEIKKSLFNTYTDIMIDFDGDDGKQRRLIIDTKYKVLNDDGRNHFNIKNTDVYQILAYRSIHQTSGIAPKVALLYPENTKPIDREFIISSEEEISFFSLTINLKYDLRTSREELISELRDKFDFVMKQKETL